MELRRAVSLLAVWGGLFLSACGGEPSASPAAPDRTGAPVPPRPADFRFATGSGGGFAGSWSETEVLPEGWVVARETGATTDGTVRVRGHLSEAVLDAVWTDLHRYGFFALEGEAGNLSEALTVRANGAVRHVAFEAGAGPPAFRALLRAVSDHLAEAAPIDPMPSAVGDGVELSVRVEPAARTGPRPAERGADPGPWSPALVLTLTNRSEDRLRVPNGQPTAGYMVAPFGLEFAIQNASGEVFGPDPGAGGPALPIGAEHFTWLDPGTSLSKRLDLGRFLHGMLPDPRRLWREPNVYTGVARWSCAPGTAPPGPDGRSSADARGIWYGTTPPVRFAFAVE